VRRVVLEDTIAVRFQHYCPAWRDAVCRSSNLDKRLQAVLVATVRVATDEEIRPASTHGAAVLTLQANPNDTISVISVVDLTSLGWNIVAEAPAGLVPVATLCIEAWTLRFAIVVSCRSKYFEQLVILNAFASVRSGEELLGAWHRVQESMRR
jgi:hypothetical protein